MMRQGLRVLIASPVCEGSLGFFCQRALERLGHQVSVFDYRLQALGPGYERAEAASWPRILRNRLGIAIMNRRLRQTVAQTSPDLVLVIKGELIEPSTVEALARGSRAALALWYPDAGRYLTKRSYRRIAQGMSHYHVTFLCDPDNVPLNLRPAIRRAEFLTFACDPEFHYRAPLSEAERARFASEVCFVGNPHGPGSLRDTTLEALSEFPLTVWGHRWEKTPLAQSDRVMLRGPAYAGDMRKVYSGAEIALNFSLDQYLIFRDFEVPACGPMLLTEERPELERYFRPGEEVVAFRGLDDLRKKLDHYLACPSEARAIAERGQRRAHTQHTFVHRMSELLDRVFAS